MNYKFYAVSKINAFTTCIFLHRNLTNPDIKYKIRQDSDSFCTLQG
jgi:hypothetical protein